MTTLKKIIVQSGRIELSEVDKDFYRLSKKVYLYFATDIISKDSIKKIIPTYENYFSSKIASKWKTIIIVGETSENHCGEDLLFFNNVDTFIVFCLFDKNSNKVYTNEKWIFALGLNYKKYTKLIKSILEASS